MRKLPQVLRLAAPIFVLSCLVAACDSSGGSDEEIEPTVYTGGEYDIGGLVQPCHWVGTKLTTLPLPSGYEEGQVNAIQVVGGTVYTAGLAIHDGATNSELPCYWTGSTLTTLPVPAGSEEAGVQTILVTGGEVYTAGYYEVGTTSDYLPCYWKGTTRTDLPTTAAEGSAIAIFVSDGKVYVAGRDGDAPCYWVDGVRTNYAVPAPGVGIAHSITVIGGVLYVGGEYEADNAMNSRVPCYWIKGARTDLAVPTPGMEDGGYRSVVVGGTVYTSGSYANGFKACYWKGTARTDLPARSGDVGAYSVNLFVTSDTVYSVGGGYPTATTTTACYWKGTERTALPVPSGTTKSGVYCIFVQ